MPIIRWYIDTFKFSEEHNAYHLCLHNDEDGKPLTLKGGRELGSITEVKVAEEEEDIRNRLKKFKAVPLDSVVEVSKI